MAYTANRLQAHWTQLRPLLLKEWARLSEADLNEVEGQFGSLVEILRQRYGGRVEIIQEASIRDSLNQWLDQLENPLA